jgi:pyruvate ferredoxin oxidoreductase alpha subunit
MKTIATGNKAVAEAVKQAQPTVIAAYPITPQTQIIEQIAEYVASGKLKSRFIPVESEHSAMAACIGPALPESGRSRQPVPRALLYMHEIDKLGGRRPSSHCHGQREPGHISRMEHLGRA